MSEEKKNGRPGKAPDPYGVVVDPAPNGDYSTSAAAAQQAIFTLVDYLPDELRGKFVKGGAFKAVREYMESTGISLPPELEDKLFSLKPIPSSRILTTEYPPLPELVPDYLAAGLSYLIGKPKAGKSWMAMQLACAVMAGGKIFDRDVQKGRVLYFALEDSERRLQKRMKLQLWPGAEGVEFVLFDEFRDKIGALNNPENSNLLLKFIQRGNYSLVIVDTFSRAILGDQLKTDEMTNALGPIQHYALSRGLAFLIIDHMPKNVNPGEYDAITNVFGSVAKAGIADTVWALYREKGRYGGSFLAITGRETEEQTLKLHFDKDFYCWQCEGPWSEVRITKKRQDILDILAEIGPVKAKELSQVLNADLSNLIKQLSELVYAEKIERSDDGFYKVI